MLKLLDAMRTQPDLFEQDAPLEDALAAMYRHIGGGQIQGDQLLDYRQYVRIGVQVQRLGRDVWADARAGALSTGESIGVGAAVLVVILDAWEQQAALLKGRKAGQALRFLFLDEANRLSPESLDTLTELLRADAGAAPGGSPGGGPRPPRTHLSTGPAHRQRTGGRGRSARPANAGRIAVSALDWQRPEVQWALVALLGAGELRRTRANAELVDWLNAVGWAGQGPRRDLFRLNPARRGDVESRLVAAWPDWQRDLAALDAEGLPRDEAGLRQLRRCRLPLVQMPERLHRKTWMARCGAHSKAGAPDAVPPPGLTLTDDDLLRLRPNQGLALRFADGTEQPCDDWVRRLGELTIPQRALDTGLRLTGTLPLWVMTVENLGAYIDSLCRRQALAVHQPGWNCRLAQRFVALLPDSVPWWHFGDLDPEGLAIFAAPGERDASPASVSTCLVARLSAYPWPAAE